MKAEEIRKISENVPVKNKEVRLEKYVEWLERDCLFEAKLGKLKCKVDYSNRPLSDEFILKIQDTFISNGFQVITNDDPNKFRQFTISWEKEENV